MDEIFKPHRYRPHMALDRVNGVALKKMAERRGLSIAKLSELASVPQSTIGNYLYGQQLLAESRTVNKLAEALKCDPIDIILCPGERSPVYTLKSKPEATVDDLMLMPKPEFVVGDKYHLKSKGGQCKEFANGYFKFIGTAPAANGRTHYMFLHTAGKYPLTLTEIDFLCKAVVAVNTKELAGKAS